MIKQIEFGHWTFYVTCCWSYALLKNAEKLLKQKKNYWSDEIIVLFAQSPLGETALETVSGIFHTTMQAFVNVQKMELQSVITYVVCRA
jgi:hypothetical protein